MAHGQALFNTLPIQITGVGGLNDALGQPVINGTCTTGQDSPNVGNHSFAVPLNIGTTAYPAVDGRLSRQYVRKVNSAWGAQCDCHLASSRNTAPEAK